MLAVRLRRAGSTQRPFFRIVVTESASARDGRFVEVIGHYNPRTRPETLVLDRGRLAHWVEAGAQLSDTVRTLVRRMPPAPAVEDAAQGTSVASEPREPSEDREGLAGERAAGVGGARRAEPA